MVVLPPRRLVMWIVMIVAWVGGLLVGRSFVYEFFAALRVVVLGCFLGASAAVLRCFEMREAMTVAVCLVDEWLLAVLVVLWS